MLARLRIVPPMATNSAPSRTLNQSNCSASMSLTRCVSFLTAPGFAASNPRYVSATWSAPNWTLAARPGVLSWTSTTCTLPPPMSTTKPFVRPIPLIAPSAP